MMVREEARSAGGSPSCELSTQPPNIIDNPELEIVKSHLFSLHSSGFGKVSGAAEPDVSPDGLKVAFTGTIWASIEKDPRSMICVVDVETGELEVIEHKGNSRLPRWAKREDRTLGFLSDMAVPGNFQFYSMSLGKQERTPAAGPDVKGSVEDYLWSADGARVMMRVGSAGVDNSTMYGSTRRPADSNAESQAWMPHVEGHKQEGTGIRSLYVNDLKAAGTLNRISGSSVNTWEATWVGGEQLAAIVSDKPGEGAWYNARLSLMGVGGSEERILYESRAQLAMPVGSDSGNRVACIEGHASDRGLVAGDIIIFDISSGEKKHFETNNVDVTKIAWRSENNLFFIGLRGVMTAAGDLDTATGTVTELMESDEAFGAIIPDASPMRGASSAFIGIREGWNRFPELSLCKNGEVTTIKSFAHDGSRWLESKIGPIDKVTWKAPDGVQIDGFLVLPVKGKAPYPLIVNVHGGPVWSYRNQWGLANPHIALLNRQGYAVLCPNSRGSMGRGQAFVHHIIGDMGGADTFDFLSGIDILVSGGIVDSSRVGIMGRSYGGFMATWLPTQSDRFAASVAVSPVTDWYSQHTTSNIGEFDKLFVGGDPYAPDSNFWKHSPVRFVGKCRTPTLLIAGDKDRCTSAGQAVQFYRGLIEHGIDSVLALYPGEGHGIRGFPAYLDFCSRILQWFDTYMPA